MLKIILIASLLGLTGISRSGTLNTNNNVTRDIVTNDVTNNGENDLYCKVITEYIKWIDEVWVNEYEFKTQEDYYAWCAQDSRFEDRFNQTYIYLYQDDSKVALFPSLEYKIYAQNHSFTFTDRYGNDETTVEVGFVEYTEHQITHLFVWDGILDTTYFKMLKYSSVTLTNTVMDGYNSLLTKDLIKLYPGGRLNLQNNSLICNYKLGEDVELVNFIPGDDFETAGAGISGDSTSGFSNITSEYGSPICMDAKNNFLDAIFFTNCSNFDGDGGVIYTTAYGKITNCVFSNNYSDDEGGAIFAKSQMEISYCTFNENTCEDDGGAIYVYKDFTKIHNCGFNRNVSGTDGGAICVDADEVDIYRCDFDSNHAKDDGGAIYVCSGADDTYIGSCTFKNNKADDDCDDIDDTSSTIIEYSGSTISNGNVVVIIILSVALLITCGILITYYLQKRKKQVKNN